MNHPYLLGTLQRAVAMYLAGKVDRDFLARILAETEAAATELETAAP